MSPLKELNKEWIDIAINKKTVLHVGCGNDPLPAWLHTYKETRLDIDKNVKPDIVASMTDIGDIGEFDLVYCQHSLEHLFRHEVAIALKEFHRVLKKGGGLVVMVPDLEDVRPTDEVILMADSGAITGMDMIYGHQQYVIDNQFMAHRTGFTKKILIDAIREAGFNKARSQRMENYNLMGYGTK